MILKKLCFIILSLYIAVTGFSQAPAFITDSLDNYINRGMKEWEIPGLAISIIKDGKIVVMKGYGVREMGKPEKVDENTLFLIASNTKLFTGTALAKAEEDKKLSLNDKVTKWLPGFRLYDSNATRMVTVRDMLSHRIGTKTFQGDFTFWDSDLSRDSVIYKMRKLIPGGEFRQDFGYCNAGYVVAGEILTKATGNSWEKYVEENLIRPLGMNNTYLLSAGVAERKNIAAPYSNSFGPLTKLPYDNIDNLAPAGSMVSSVKDVSKWLMMQLDSGKLNGTRILPWSVLQKTRDANTFTGSRKSTVYPTHFRAYGLGVFMTDYNGRQAYWHTGGAFGFVTNTCFIPEEKLAITILTNNDNQNFFEALRYQIMDAYLGVPYTNRSNFQMGFAVQAKQVTMKDLQQLNDRVAKQNKPELNLNSFTGTYRNDVYGNINIENTKDGLVVNFSHHPNLTASLVYMDNNEFRMTYSNPAFGIFPATFKVENGKVKAVIIKASDFVEFDPYYFMKL
jgi:CubicO group peptidase (beta-lactamase class C family)